MQRAWMWLNLYGHQAVRRKLSNRLKMHFFVFLACFRAYVCFVFGVYCVAYLDIRMMIMYDFVFYISCSKLPYQTIDINLLCKTKAQLIMDT